MDGTAPTNDQGRVPPTDWLELSRTAEAWGLTLSKEQIDQLRRYLEDLLQYNLKVNLTAEKDPAAIVFRHIADGLAAISPLKSRLGPSPEILDLGAGGGFIGMAIKIGWPEAKVTLMEPLQRKYRFLSGTSVRSGLKGLRVLKMTAEEAWGKYSGHFDAVVERALAELPEAKRLAMPLVRENGFFLAYQSTPGGEIDFPYRLPREEKNRYLAIFGKTPAP